ncbi:MAG: host attachment family protein [Oricola sp.]
MADTKLKKDGWLVVADGEKALFLRNEGDEINPNLKVFRELEHENPPTHDQGTDQPGRFTDGSGPHRSAVEETDWHRVEKQRFAAEIAERLHRQASKGAYSELVIVAPPQILGDMRKALNKDVQDRIVAEIAKDLTKHPVHEIEKLVLG